MLRADEMVARFPRGWRLVTDPSGTPSAVVGVAASAVSGTVEWGDVVIELTLEPNERVELAGGRVSARHTIGFTAPRF